MEAMSALHSEHPLVGVEQLDGWKKWKELWDANTSAEVRCGLLHYGFGVHVDQKDEEERIRFYLEVADGYADERNFVLGDETSLRYNGELLTPFGTLRGKGLSQLRQKVAEKAFEMLAIKLFKPSLQDRTHYWRLIVQPPVLEKFFWFFRWEENGIGYKQLRNFPFSSRSEIKKIHAEITWDFLLKFCDFAFTFTHFGEYSDDSDTVIRGRLRQFWPKVAEILYFIGETRMLLDGGFKEIISDPQCLKTLESLVLEYEIWFPNDPGNKRRSPKTIEEALYVGSRGAATLYVLRAKKAEQERLNKIREAEEVVRKAELAKERATRTIAGLSK